MLVFQNTHECCEGEQLCILSSYGGKSCNPKTEKKACDDSGEAAGLIKALPLVVHRRHTGLISDTRILWKADPRNNLRVERAAPLLTYGKHT